MHNRSIYQRKYLLRLFAFMMAILYGLSNAQLVMAKKLIDKYEVLFNNDSVTYDKLLSYDEVLNNWLQEGYTPVANTTSAVTVDVQNLSAFKGEKPTTETQEQITGLVSAKNADYMDWKFTVETEGLYALEIGYYAKEGTGLPIQRSILVDGELAFDEAETVVLPRYYTDASLPKTNSLGDETTPMQKEINGWFKQTICDMKGLHNTPLLWKLEAGEHTLRMVFIDQPALIGSMQFIPPQSIPTYNEVYADYIAQGYQSSSEIIEIQSESFEHISRKSSNSMSLYYDGDPETYPHSIKQRKLNAIGGYSWRSGNQEITYTFTVPKSGLYKMAMRVQQKWNGDVTTYRQITIDGKVPFDEMNSYPFSYSQQWYTEILSDQNREPYAFYFTQGEHTVSFNIRTHKDIQKAIRIADECVEEISQIYQQILMITGAEPDANYDYELEKSIPNLISTLEQLQSRLYQATTYVKNCMGVNATSLNSVYVLIKQLKELSGKPEKIPLRLNDIADSMTLLGNWTNELQVSPMGMDYFGFYPLEYEVPQRVSSVWSRIWVTLHSFIISFQKDYNAVGSYTSDNPINEQITVWISRGVEWANILQELIDSDFTNKQNIGVKLNILPSNSLSGSVNAMLLAITSGNSPDVALSVSPDIPVEYGIRGMSVDLSKLDGFDTVSSRFLKNSFHAYSYKNQVFALPETVNFSVMIYRKDIFGRLNAAVPNTWTEVYYKLLPILYQNNMQMAAPGFDLLLYQRGGSYYTENGRSTSLNTPEAYEAFEEMTSLYLDLGFPISANFFNRFRIGEMPIGIIDYSLYMQILTAAPELTGKWDIALIPGIEQPDGSINRTNTSLTGLANIILSNSDNVDSSWAFLSWLSGKDVQKSYGQQIEGRIGTSARWNSANIEAFAALPWNQDHLDVITASWDWATSVPNVLGGVITSRALSNATNNALYNRFTPREALEDAISIINKELQRKQDMYD